ncbi:hypothetical protein HMPREF1502_2394 [Klebsiella sp. AS10]|uniref:Uncharacterized protein n=1 Tax=Klebsiella michiganensis (strain ATCC 8724 / DSM 4798 / JCM 20051 / NBRC 3318 / NRRL B-199 / KCTC 1686 / BUCSAV 143 / CCM 1901) TaxID=1006551 RepID=A0A0H3HFF4_KLEM8|nr:hypothetical protein KOX_22415 [Klebsiella michiganensis KCTC 1686]AOV12564.1 hypothetical protein BJF97_16570 [Klebsiella sp. LTGPAF-6F]EUB41725.1 hypothetical protein HMPREF1502_2394 [Klebsiella sp. AS10]GKQ25947.1 hypothetical protein NUBL17187_37430 [Klebsiella michiganensis]
MALTLTQWVPALLFEVKSRLLRLLRVKAARSETDKTWLQPEMDQLLAGLRQAVRCFAVEWLMNSGCEKWRKVIIW